MKEGLGGIDVEEKWAEWGALRDTVGELATALVAER